LLGVARPRGTHNTLAFVSGTVLIEATATVPPAAPNHDRAATIGLARAADTHLRTVAH
jgi:hypothetical protein